MTFVNTSAIFLLALLLVPLVLYLLPMPRRQVKLPSVLLWRKTIQERLKRSSWQWLRTVASLALQVSILVLLILAAGKPIRKAFTGGSDRVVIVLDNSASMRVRDGEGTRFDTGRRRASDIMQSAGAETRILLVSAGGRAQVVCPFTRSHIELAKRLSEMTLTDGTTDLAGALKLALAAVEGRKDVSVFVISDGAADLAALPAADADVRFQQVGASAENVGITQCLLRRGLDNPEDVQVVTRVANNTASDRQVPLKLTVDDMTIHAVTLQVPAGSAINDFWEGKNADGGVLRAIIDSDDALATDNVAFANLPSGKKVPVLLVSDGRDAYIESALSANLRVETWRIPTAKYEPAKSMGVNILNGFVPSDLPVGHLLIINSPASGSLYEATETIDQPQVTDWDRSHPVMAGLNLDNLSILKALKLSKPEWATVLARSDDVPLVMAGEYQKRKVVVIGFGPDDSSLPLRAAFPLLIDNAVRWLTEERELAGPEVAVGGAMVVTPASTALTEIKVTDPAGTTTRVPVRQGRAVYADTRLAGPYTVTLGNRELHFVADSPAAGESDLAVRKSLVIGGCEYAAGSVTHGVSASLWIGFALAAAALLAVDWLLYHRRVTV